MAKTLRNIRGSVVAITGGARGIGRATAAACVSAGCRVAIGDLDAELAERTAAELGGETLGLSLNVCDRPSFEHFLDEVERTLGPVDVVVNNAGIMHLGAFRDEDDATAVRMVDINLHGVITGSKLALERFQPRNRGHLVNIASSAGKVGVPGGATYCATKHAVVGLSEAVRQELRGTPIDVSVVMPGVVRTELASGLEEGRAVQLVEPSDVGDAIVEALRTGRFEVYVPKSIGSINAVMATMPRRVREAVGRALKVDRILWDADPQARAAYESRAASSEPGVEPATEREHEAVGH